MTASQHALTPRPMPEKRRIPTANAEITAAALDGDPTTGLEQETARIGQKVNLADRILGRDGNPRTSTKNLDRIQDREDRHEAELQARDDASLEQHHEQGKKAFKLPTPWDKPSPWARPRGM